MHALTRAAIRSTPTRIQTLHRSISTTKTHHHPLPNPSTPRPEKLDTRPTYAPLPTPSPPLESYALSEPQLRALIDLYHASQEYITPETLSDKIDDAFIPNRPKHLRSESYLELVGRRNEMAMEPDRVIPNANDTGRGFGSLEGMGGLAPASQDVWSSSKSERARMVMAALWGVDPMAKIGLETLLEAKVEMDQISAAEEPEAIPEKNDEVAKPAMKGAEEDARRNVEHLKSGAKEGVKAGTNREVKEDPKGDIGNSKGNTLGRDSKERVHKDFLEMLREAAGDFNSGVGKYMKGAPIRRDNWGVKGDPKGGVGKDTKDGKGAPTKGDSRWEAKGDLKGGVGQDTKEAPIRRDNKWDVKGNPKGSVGKDMKDARGSSMKRDSREEVKGEVKREAKDDVRKDFKGGAIKRDNEDVKDVKMRDGKDKKVGGWNLNRNRNYNFKKREDK
ncbi:hypothetical protein CTheo_3159 [Ceratobasidium theobromae]|uniref:Uncharacterized protein n=1 Tax=Ceratobasidium theobromae TaxID=1582974 RepID=A0A5N5QPG8_9AGAM|nr:hypothetical protein CTheo_3159 [Ceratobasidium theobromae]